MKPPKTYPEVTLSVSAFSEKGYGVGFLPSQAKVEIAHAVPGDQVKIGLQRKSKGVKKGKLLEILQPSSDRIQPKCPHVGLCGGCAWQQMSYEAQIKHKEEIILTSFRPYLSPSTTLSPLIVSQDPWEYRNKMEFTFSENAAKTRFLGLMIAHAGYVFNLETCFLARPWVSEVLRRVRAWWEESGLPAYRLDKNSGFLRHLTMREGMKTGDRMVILTVSGNVEFPQEYQESFCKAVLSCIGPENLTIILREQKIAKGTPTTIYETPLFGKGHIEEKLEIFSGDKPLIFRIGPSSFFQPNTIQAEILYRKGLELLQLSPHALVYDLYSGTGTLGMAIAKGARKVVGIELNQAAVQNAKENSAYNKIDNFEMHEGDVGKVLTRLLASPEYQRPEAVIVDPPRAGLDPLALHHLKTLKPKKILYISCNPRTQAENVGELLRFGYQLERLQPVDQFPHTAHVENIALLLYP